MLLSPRVCHSHWDGIPPPLQETALSLFPAWLVSLSSVHADLLVLSWHSMCQCPFLATFALCLFVVWTPATDSGCCYCLLLALFHSVTQNLTLCLASLAFPTLFLLSPLILLIKNWFLNWAHCPVSRFLGTAMVWRHHPLPQAGVMEDSCITHLCSSHSLVSGFRGVKPS